MQKLLLIKILKHARLKMEKFSNGRSMSGWNIWLVHKHAYIFHVSLQNSLFESS